MAQKLLGEQQAYKMACVLEVTFHGLPECSEYSIASQEAN